MAHKKSNPIKKWKIIRNISIAVFVFFVIFLIGQLIFDINLTYPHPMLGIEANSWIDQYMVDILFMLIYFAVPLILATVLLPLSISKIKRNETNAESQTTSQEKT